MTDIAHAFLTKTRSLLVSERLPQIAHCVDLLSDEDVWWRPNETSNSIGNLMLHLNGNITQWIIGGVGQRPFERARQQEFGERRSLPRHEVLNTLTGTVKDADQIIGALDAPALLEPRRIQNYDVTVLYALYHVAEHFSLHTGQIIFLTKARTGRDLKLWTPPPVKP